MSYIEDSVQADIDTLDTALNPGDSWDGYSIVPVETISGSGVKVTAVTNRDILLKVGGIMVPMDSLSINTTENIQPVHGASRARAYALAGGDIDSNYSVEFGTWLSMEQVEALREALFAGPHGEAVYHSVVCTFLGDPAKGYAGRHPLVSLLKCKAKSDSWTFSQGGPGKSKFDGLALEYFWYGRI